MFSATPIRAAVRAKALIELGVLWEGRVSPVIGICQNRVPTIADGARRARVAKTGGVDTVGANRAVNTQVIKGRGGISLNFFLADIALQPLENWGRERKVSTKRW